MKYSQSKCKAGTLHQRNTSHIRGDSVLDTSDRRDLYSYSDDEITSHPHGPHLHPPEDDSYYNPTPKSATPKLMNPVRKQTAPAAASEDKRTRQNSYSNRVC